MPSLNKMGGFTIIEMLIAMTIFSVAASGVYYSLYTGIGFWRRSSMIMDENQELRFYISELSRRIENYAAFSGRGNVFKALELSFVSSLATHAENGIDLPELAQVDCRIDESGKEVCISTARFSAPKGTSEKIILKHYSGRFIYGRKTGQGLEWMGEWDAEDETPQAIKVCLEKAGPEKGTIRTYEKIFRIRIAPHKKQYE